MTSVQVWLGPFPNRIAANLPLPLFSVPTMAARVFNLDELATRIATHLAIHPGSTVALALTCRALEVPALRALWGARLWSLNQVFMRVLSTDAWCFVFPTQDSDSESDFCLLVSLLFPSARWTSYLLTIDHKIDRRYSDRSLRGSWIDSSGTPRGYVALTCASGASRRNLLDSWFPRRQEPLPSSDGHCPHHGYFHRTWREY